MNGVRKHGGCDSNHDITYFLKKEKRNGICKVGGCDSKHNITNHLRKKETKSVRMEDVIKIQYH